MEILGLFLFIYKIQEISPEKGTIELLNAYGAIRVQQPPVPLSDQTREGRTVMKKLFALFMALTLGLMLGIPAFAAGSPGSASGKITITNVQPHSEYTAYRIFDAVQSEGGTTSYAVNPVWMDFLAQDQISGPKGYIQLKPVGNRTYVYWNQNISESEKGAVAAKLARFAMDYATNPMHPVEGDATASEHGGCAVFDHLSFGCYLINTSVSTLCAVNSEHSEFTAADKNETPTIRKEVLEGTSWVMKNDASIGDTLEYRSIITVQKGAENYRVLDIMGRGLDFQGISKVTMTPFGTTAAKEVSSKNYTVDFSVTPEENKTFSLSFNNGYLSTLNPGDVLTIYYTAKVNDKAGIRNSHTDYNQNWATLKYGNNHQTAPTSTTTQVWDFKIQKYAIQDGTEQALAGASFQLHRNTEDGALVSVIQSKNSTDYVVCENNSTSPEHGAVTEMTTGRDGMLHIIGLDSGTYYLEETHAPTGYNPLDHAVEIQINKQGNVYLDTQLCAAQTVKIENKKGSELPETGGVGTTLFYLAGGVLTASAAGLLLAHRRKSSGHQC